MKEFANESARDARLASLIPTHAIDGGKNAKMRFRMVPIDEIRPNPQQPRLQFEPIALQELAETIKELGLLTPLSVTKKDGDYILIAGERRLRAAALAGLNEVPVVLQEVRSPLHSLELALVENLQREALGPIECARGYDTLITEFGLSQEEVAARVGKARPTIANTARLLLLPTDIQEAIQMGDISAGHGRALIGLVKHQALKRVFLKILDDRLNVRAAEQLVRAELTGKPTKKRKENITLRKRVSGATKILTQHLHTTVEIKPKRNGSGQVVVKYASEEELERIINIIREGALK